MPTMNSLYALSSMLSSDFWFMIITILYLLTSCLTPCVLLYQSPTVILLYHEYSLLDITCYISTSFCMLVLTTRFLMHIYDRIYRYMYAYLRKPLGISITTRRGVLTPLDPHVQVSELGACRLSQLLIRDVQR